MKNQDHPRVSRRPRRRRNAVRRIVLSASLLSYAGLATPPSFAEPGPSRTAGSRAASELLGEGSVLVVSGTAELLATSGQFVIDSVQTTARGVQLVLRPVGHAVSATAEAATAVTVELSHAAWSAASHGIVASGQAVGTALETVVLTAASATAAGSAVAYGTALVLGDLVLGIVPAAELEELLHHGVHTCENAS